MRVAPLALRFATDFGVKAYTRVRRLQTDTEVLALRTRTLRLELGELEQKLRVMNRVGYFVDRAVEQGFSADKSLWHR